ncbi:hypothetical protein [Streptomyces sp. NPDC093111]|uniref:hypothetical protein n=1 Tax=Streptomyces sp. NPDC093111 TaxID=3154978 RepID=UPI0034387541
MKRTVILLAAGLVVAAASVCGAIAVLQDGPSTIDAMCVEQDETDRDKAGLVDHVAVVTVDQNLKVKQEAPSSAAYLTSRVHVEETLKGTVPTAATVEGAVNVTPTDAYQAAAPHQQPLLPGHRYVIGVQDWPGYDGQIGADVPFPGGDGAATCLPGCQEGRALQDRGRSGSTCSPSPGAGIQAGRHGGAGTCAVGLRCPTTLSRQEAMPWT